MAAAAVALAVAAVGWRMMLGYNLRVMAISTVPDLSGSGRVDMLTRPVALPRAAVVATGASG